jgi:D-methionine transport system substrate-binding protein
VVLEKTPDYYLNVVAVKSADKDAPWARDIAEAYRSKEFKAVVDSKFQGYAKPSFLQ